MDNLDWWNRTLFDQLRRCRSSELEIYKEVEEFELIKCAYTVLTYAARPEPSSAMLDLLTASLLALLWCIARAENFGSLVVNGSLKGGRRAVAATTTLNILIRWTIVIHNCWVLKVGIDRHLILWRLITWKVEAGKWGRVLPATTLERFCVSEQWVEVIIGTIRYLCHWSHLFTR